ncbi:MAG: hypothetical protein CML68_02505 [Rhodobacteraceae bacterium]|nr:hypothetical protein [Paracoccaceae bacterium]
MAALAGLLLGSSPSLAQDVETARFVVSPDVVAADLPPLTATIDAFGNGARLSSTGGFEPTVFRTLLRVTKTAQDQVITSQADLTGYDSWREGAFDGADVEVLRIENGRFVSVRRDRVRDGGHRATGWIPQLGGKVLSGRTGSVSLSWEGWNRLGVPYYYTVRAVNWRGRLSPPAEAIAVTAPAEPGKASTPETIDRPKLSDTPGRLSAPTRLQAMMQPDQTLRLGWDAVPGARGYVVYRSDVPPDQHRGYGLDLEGSGPEIRAGDMVILRQRFLAPKRDEVLTNRVWSAHGAIRLFRPDLLKGFADDQGQASWALEEHPAETTVEAPGETYLTATLFRDRPLEIGLYNHSGTAQSWYEVLDPSRTYRFEVWLRGDPGVQARFAIKGPLRDAPGQPVNLPVTAEWRKHVVEFRVPRIFDGEQAGWMGLVLGGTGEVSIDNFRIYRTDAPYLAWLPEDHEALVTSGMGQLRTHGFIKTMQRTYDLAQLTNPAGGISTAKGNTLPQTLAGMASVGMDPWLQIEPHLAPEEWLGLVEFLAAPFGPGDDPATKPWAAKRASQGQVAPYTDLFDHIRFEIGNETWNRLFRPWVFEDMTDAATGEQYSRGEVYGLYQEYVLSILRSSPYWPALEPHLQPVLGGWAISDYGFAAARRSPSSPLVTNAAYNGGWDEGEGPVAPSPSGFASILGFPVQVAARRSQSDASNRDATAEGRGEPLEIGTYEAGPGYALNGLNNQRVTKEQAALQEEAMKSSAAGTATLDTFLMQARHGFRVQNYFTFGRGPYWTSHATWENGGQPYPAWQWLTVLNNGGKGLGDMLKVDPVGVPRRDLPEMSQREALEDAPMVDIYPLLQGERLLLVVLSRLVPDVPTGTAGVTDVTILLPFKTSSSMVRFTMSGDYTTSNVDGPRVLFRQNTMKQNDHLSQLRIENLEPGSAQIYLIEVNL